MTNRASTSLILCLLPLLAFGAAACGDEKSGGGGDASVDASGDAASDAATEPDAATPDAEVPEVPFALFAHIDETLFSVNLTTGALTSVGETGQEWIVLAWDDAAKVARVITGVYSPVGGGATPKLGTIDLCTGTITDGPALTENESAVRRAEGLARDPESGEFWITYGKSGTGAPTQYLSERIGKVDVSTGEITDVGALNTIQDDGDGLHFVDGELLTLDIATDLTQGTLYSVNETTGATTVKSNPGPTVLRIAYAPDTETVYAARGSTNFMDRGVGTLNIESGTFTAIGDGIDNAEFPGLQFNGLIAARAPSCD